MNQRAYKLRVGNNPLVQFVTLILAGLLTIAAVLLGAVLLSLLLGLAVLAGAVLFARVWWLRRRMQRVTRAERGARPGEIIDVQYSVVEERRIDENSVDEPPR